MESNETLGALLALATGVLGLAITAIELGKAALGRRRERRQESAEEGGCDAGEGAGDRRARRGRRGPRR